MEGLTNGIYTNEMEVQNKIEQQARFVRLAVSEQVSGEKYGLSPLLSHLPSGVSIDHGQNMYNEFPRFHYMEPVFSFFGDLWLGLVVAGYIWLVKTDRAFTVKFWFTIAEMLTSLTLLPFTLIKSLMNFAWGQHKRSHDQVIDDVRGVLGNGPAITNEALPVNHLGNRFSDSNSII